MIYQRDKAAGSVKGRHTTIVSDAKVEGPLYHYRIIVSLVALLYLL